MHSLKRIVRCLLVLAVALAAAAPAHAQSPLVSADGSGGSGSPEISTEAIRDLIVTLESETGRTELIDQLKTLLAARRHADGEKSGFTKSGTAAEADKPLFDTITSRVRHIGQSVVESAQIVAQVPRLIPWLSDQVSDPAKRMRWADAFFKIALVLVAAVVAQLVVGWLLRRPLGVLETRPTDGWLARVLTLFARLLLELVPIAFFALTAEVVIAILDTREVVVSAARAFVLANVLVRVVLVVTRAMIAPRVEQLRLVHMDSETAQYVFIWVRRFAFSGLYVAFAIEAAGVLGLPSAGRMVLYQLLALVLAGMAIALILQIREPVRDLVAGSKDGAAAGLRARLADIWHVVAILYIVMLFGVWMLDVSGEFMVIARGSGLTLLGIIGAWLVDFGIDRLLNSLFALKDETRERFPGLEARAARYLPLVHGIVRVMIWIVAAVVVAEAWGANAVGWLTSATGKAIIAALVQILVVSVLSIALLEFISSAIERYMRRSRDDGTSTARMLTLLPLLRNALRIAIAVIATLIVLSEIGIDIGPLLAGAGVAGLAIGFGAQKLVQDVINGMFIIIEDTVAVGDVVSLAGHTGLCEAITIRTITLRDLSGTVHTVPFSDVTTVENLTKDFSFAMMDIGVAYREDTDAVVDLLRQVDAEMRGEDEFASSMTEPLEVLGVEEFADSAVIIRVRIKTLPIQQWTVKREFFRRMKKLFDANGIEIPFPHTTLYFGEDKQGKAPPAQIVVQEHIEKRDGNSDDATGDAAAQEKASPAKATDSGEPDASANKQDIDSPESANKPS